MKNDLSSTQIFAETKGSSCSKSIDRISVSREQRLLIMDWIWSKGSIDDKIASYKLAPTEDDKIASKARSYGRSWFSFQDREQSSLLQGRLIVNVL